MRVLLLNQTFYPDNSATAQQLTDLAQFLVKENCEVSVVTEKREYESRRIKYPAREIYKGVKIFRVWSTGFGKLSFLKRFIDGMTFELFLFFRLLFFKRQDVVISFTSPPLLGCISVIFGTLWGARKIQWLMDINPDIALAVGYIKEGSFLAHILNKFFKFSLKYSTDIVVLDRCMKDRILSKGIEQSKISIIPPWPVHNFEYRFDTIPKNNIFRQSMKLENKFVVCYSGNHSIVHPLDTILEAIRNLAIYEDIVFLFIGGGLRVRDVTEYKEKYGLKNIIQLPSQPRETIKYSLTAADVHIVVMGDKVNGLVHISKIYGVLATGRPYIYIGPSNSAISDILNECPYGLHIENGDVEGLISGLLKMKNLTKEELTNIERNNIDYIMTHHSLGLSMKKLLKLLSLYEQPQEVLLKSK